MNSIMNSIRCLLKRVNRIKAKEGEYYASDSSFITAMGFENLTPFERVNPDGTKGYDWDGALKASIEDTWSDFDQDAEIGASIRD